MNENIEYTAKKAADFLRRNKYAMLVLLIGVVLLLIPAKKDDTQPYTTAASGEYTFTIENYEERLTHILSEIDGAGKVSVLLYASSAGQRVLAEDSSYSENVTGGGDDSERSIDEQQSVLVISGAGGGDEVVTTKYIYPEFNGAVIVAQGADSSRVRLDITDAVKAATGLSADKIKVIRMK